MGRWRMEWAGRANHMGGIPRKLVIGTIGSFAKLAATVLNSTSVHNSQTLLHLVRSRPPNTPLITVSNHMSTLDDPVMWGFKGFPICDPKLARWVLAAEDICFKNPVLAYFFRLVSSMRRWRMEWAGRANHMGGIPRKLVIGTIGSFAKLAATILNSTSVHNSQTLLHLVRSRPPNTPLITVSNHMSTLDDPVMWGFKGFPICDPKLARWVLAAEDICFKNPVLAYFFRLGKCIPITRGGGIYQEHMNEAIERLQDGGWLHTFPEGKVSQEGGPLRRLKWGTASLIERASVTPIVLPIVHHGFEKVMPEKYYLNRRPPFPLTGKEIKIIIGEPIDFNLPESRQKAISMTRTTSSLHKLGWPTSPHGLDEAAQRWLYSDISDRIWSAMEDLRSLITSKV